MPGNRFEALIGDRKGQYSIRINNQWRVCYRLLATADPDEEDRLYSQLAKIFQEDMPLTRLLPWSEVAYMEELWLEDGRQQ